MLRRRCAGGADGADQSAGELIVALPRLFVINGYGGGGRHRGKCYVRGFIGKLGANIPLGRFGRPEEFAAMVCLLASDLGGFTTGTAINMDGGACPVVYSRMDARAFLS